MTADEVEALLDRFFGAIEAGDVDTVAELYADDVRVWHNLTGVAADRTASLRILRWLMAPGVTRRYEVHERLVAGDRVAQRHTLRVRVAGHPEVVMPVAIFLTVHDGQVHAIEEYTDKEGTDTLLAIVPA